MTIVFVHGNPETDAIWGPLLEHLDVSDDVVLLSPPGFGSPLPDGFPATHEAYRDWLEQELSRFAAPVDLVGHDWGGGHVLNVVMHRPESVRSWVSDVVGLFDAEYQWHDLAQVWQTPGAGEELIDQMLGAPLPERTAMNESLGMPADVAAAVAAGQNAEMGQAILSLYRSALQPADLGRNLDRASARPGLSVLATADPYGGSEELRRRASERAGAEIAVLEGLGHWWMLQDPARGAAALTAFWDGLPAA